MITKEKIRLAAEGCYYPIREQWKAAMADVIAELVLPPDMMSYTIEDIQSAITSALEEKEQ